MEGYCGICNAKHSRLSGSGGNYLCVACASSSSSSSSSSPSIPPSSLTLSGTLLSLLYEEASYTDSYVEGLLKGQFVTKQYQAVSDYEEESIIATVTAGVTRFLSYKGRIQDFHAEIGRMKEKEVDSLMGCFLIRRDKVSQPSFRNVQYLQALQRVNKNIANPVLLVLNVPGVEKSSPPSSSWIINMSYNAYVLSADSSSITPLPVHIITTNSGSGNLAGHGNKTSTNTNVMVDESLFNFNSFVLYDQDDCSNDDQKKMLENKTNLDIINTTDTFIQTIQKLDDIKGEIMQVIDLEKEVSSLRQRVKKQLINPREI